MHQLFHLVVFVILCCLIIKPYINIIACVKHLLFKLARNILLSNEMRLALMKKYEIFKHKLGI